MNCTDCLPVMSLSADAKARRWLRENKAAAKADPTSPLAVAWAAVRRQRHAEIRSLRHRFDHGHHLVAAAA